MAIDAPGRESSAAELEQTPALSVTLLSLPGASIATQHLSTEELPDLDGAAQQRQDWVGITPEAARSQILLIDPTSRGINDLISGLDYAYPSAEKIGGIAAPHNSPHGSLLLDDHVVTGAVVCSIGGSWRLETVVAQGCRPIGPVARPHPGRLHPGTLCQTILSGNSLQRSRSETS